jgi:hypothetical protein
MEVERMSRIHNVVKEIAKEHHINLNTASLSLVMVALQKKILLFADEKTKRDIEQLETFLKHDEMTEAKKLTEVADDQADSLMRAYSETIDTDRMTGGAWLPTGWSSRWLSPDETLRQIIRDITIANVWFSIMLGEFDLFMRFVDEKTDEWKRSKAMRELLIANRQLGTTTAVNRSTDPDFDLFYSTLDMKEAATSIKQVMLTLREPAAGGSSKSRQTRRRARAANNLWSN